MEYAITTAAATSSRNSTSLLVTFQYFISKQKIVSKVTEACYRYRGIVLAYTTELAVEKPEDYSEIPTSSWTLTLLVSRQQGIHAAELVCRNADGEPCGPLVEFTVSPTATSAPAVCIAWEAPEDHRVSINANYYCSEFVPGSSKPAKTLLPGYLYVSLTYRLSRPAVERRLLPSTDTFPDCTLLANDGRRFAVHRCIVATQSSVFLSIFQGSRVPLNRELYFVDVCGDILEMVVKFLYTRQIEGHQQKDIQELWCVASQYGLRDLKQGCEERLFNDAQDFTINRHC